MAGTASIAPSISPPGGPTVNPRSHDHSKCLPIWTQFVSYQATVAANPLHAANLCLYISATSDEIKSYTGDGGNYIPCGSQCHGYTCVRCQMSYFCEHWDHIIKGNYSSVCGYPIKLAPV